MSSDLPGVNLATLNGILLYYRLMTKWSGLGDSTELSRVGLSHDMSSKTLYFYYSTAIRNITIAIIVIALKVPFVILPRVPEISGPTLHTHMDIKVFVLTIQKS
jgi:hypothetical protein